MLSWNGITDFEIILNLMFQQKMLKFHPLGSLRVSGVIRNFPFKYYNRGWKIRNERTPRFTYIFMCILGACTSVLLFRHCYLNGEMEAYKFIDYSPLKQRPFLNSLENYLREANVEETIIERILTVIRDFRSLSLNISNLGYVHKPHWSPNDSRQK